MPKSALQKKKDCKICKKSFIPWSSFAKTCSVECALELVRIGNEKDERKKTKLAREKLKTKGDWAGEAQTAFNRWVRACDPYGTCNSCGRIPKKRNAGHYRSVGAAPELRYCLYNVHLQCEHCNTHKSGNAIEYRIRLVKKIGAENVEWLEGKHEPKKYTIDELKEIKQGFNSWARELEKELD